MACSYPMFRLDYERAKLLYDFPAAFENRCHNKGIIMNKDEASYFKTMHPLMGNYISQIPCGKCIQCRLSYSRDWANRCMCELKTNPCAVFVTLTYDDAHLTFAPYADPELGTVDTRPCLVPRDLTLFLKRLRSYCDRNGYSDSIRFFACGEYGEESERPHYHLIIFGLDLDKIPGRHVWRRSAPDTPALWTHKVLSDCWSLGLSCYGAVTWETCAYVARYVVKKRKGLDRKSQIESHKLLGLPPWPEEFVRMSRMPGLGRDYFDRSKSSIYATDEIFVPIGGSMSSVRPCKYYDRLYDLEDSDRMHDIKLKRSKLADNAMQVALTKTDLTEEEYLLMKDRSKLDQSRRLVRPSI